MGRSPYILWMDIRYGRLIERQVSQDEGDLIKARQSGADRFMFGAGGSFQSSSEGLVSEFV